MSIFKEEILEKIAAAKKLWEERVLGKALERFGVKKSHQKYYSPLDIKNFDFLEKIGFPGYYPYTSGEYPATPPPVIGEGGAALIRAGGYSGYGTAEDTRDYYKQMISIGFKGGPNLAFDLPTQCGYDSDDPMAAGEVGKVGVAVDTLADFETIYEAYAGVATLDQIASNFTINAPANIIIAMYIALAEKKGVPVNMLRGTPQNDILKEFVARGTYIFPPKPSMRMIRDTITYCSEHLPLLNTISICGFHIREAGATAAQVNAFVLANGMSYVKLGIEAGLDVDSFVKRFTFLPFSGSMEIFKEIARARAARRMWAKIMRDRFQAKNPRSWILRGAGGAMVGWYNTTTQRPLNNITRGALGGLASALSGGPIFGGVPYDEPMGLGHSMEARQISMDAGRVLQWEAKLGEVPDPLAGSYYVEGMTDQIEEEAWKYIEAIDSMGGAVAAIENGYMQKEIAKSAFQYQKEIENGERVVVGVNRFIGEHELEVTTTRLVDHPYDPRKREEAEEKQLARLKMIKRERDSTKVSKLLEQLREAAHQPDVNLIPIFIDLVKAYATIGEMCRVLREIFGEFEQSKAL